MQTSIPQAISFLNCGANYNAVTNTPPGAPSGLSASVTGHLTTLNWNSATDSQTPADVITYNLRVGTVPSGSDVLAPGGFRRAPQIGNAQHGLTALLNYTPGTPCYWSVQAVDGAFAGSAFATEGSFCFFQSPPLMALVTTTNLVPDDVNGDGILDQIELNTVLGCYLPASPFLQMTNVAGLGGTNVTFALTNDLAGAFSV